MKPSRDFVEAMGLRLKEFSTDIHAVPKVNQSLFRIHRDTRFSENKTPFKTNLAMVFWEGGNKRMENSSFYFHYEPPNLLLGVGIYKFSKPVLQAYRDYVAHPKHAAELQQIITDLEAQDGYNNVWGKNYKKVPRGYDKDYEYADLLLYDGITIGVETPTPAAFYTPDLIDYCATQWAIMIFWWQPNLPLVTV